MKYFLDTKFIDDGFTIELISIGIVAEDGREFYNINRNCKFWNASEWVRDNVLEPMGILIHGDFQAIYQDTYDISSECVKHDITKNIIEFFNGDYDIEIWGWYCSYDWVVFCQLFGPMVDIPKGMPYSMMDLRQAMRGIPKHQRPKVKGNHNALDDARGIRDAFMELEKLQNKK